MTFTGLVLLVAFLIDREAGLRNSPHAAAPAAGESETRAPQASLQA
jgi:hypothetical protein